MTNKSWQHVYLIGIGGIGMGGLAEVLRQKGVRVSGSDRTENNVTMGLRRLGAVIEIGHENVNLNDVDVVVCSSAVAQDNPIIVAAKKGQLPILARAEMLAYLLQDKQTIAVSGTHGKTTTSSLIAHCLAAADMNPSFFVGGLPKGATHTLGLAYDGGPFASVEADESDASLLHLSPKIAVVTNLDADHLENYPGGFQQLQETFVAFLAKLPSDGLIVACTDDERVQAILANAPCQVITYGFNAEADVQVLHCLQKGVRLFMRVQFGQEIIETGLALPGEHNALNATAALIVAKHLGVLPQASQALTTFAGVARRFHQHGPCAFAHGEALVVEDYGHHPKELAVTLKAIHSAWPEKRVVMVFQPHRYSRTKAMLHEFAAVLQQADRVILLPVYTAGESWCAGGDSEALLAEILSMGDNEQRRDAINISKETSNKYFSVNHEEALRELLNQQIREGDILLIQGAGDVGKIALSLSQSYSQQPLS